ncbi:MAG: hypothetical protein SVO26_07740, partial [Chloroflexota bacterium]|nr:hypothetical protein [Chloroflexota bacterium]
ITDIRRGFFYYQNGIEVAIPYHRVRAIRKKGGEVIWEKRNVSQHLAILRERGVVSTRHQGTTVFYRLTSPKIGEACDLVRGVLEDQLDNNRILADSIGSR